MSRPKGQGNGCCSPDFLKQVLCILNIVSLIAGLVVLAISIWTIVDRFDYVVLLSTPTYPIITYFLLSAGVLVIFVTAIGYCALSKDSRLLLLFYSFCLLLIFLVEAMVGIVALVYREQVHADLMENLNATLLNEYKIDEDKTIATDFLQETFQCCGSVTFSDWKYGKFRTDNQDEHNLVPDSCCKTISVSCGRRDHPSNINYSGCLEKMEDHMKFHLSILCGVGLGICIIHIFGLIYGFQLYLRLRPFKPVKTNKPADKTKAQT